MNKKRTSQMSIFPALLFLLDLGFVSWTKETYDVAAFVWPSYHPDDRAKIFWPDGIGEWQTVMSNTAQIRRT